MESPYKKKIINEKKAGKAGAPEPADRSRRRNLEIAVIVILLMGVGVLGYAFVYRVFIAPPINAEIERQSGLTKKDARIQVNILNATPQHDLARRVMDYLRARGFDVVEIGNYSSEQSRSLVIDRTGDSLSARKVAFAMGIPDSSIRKDVDSSLYLDVSVVLGNDFEQLKPWK
ncbi:MAG TPA: LytR C-terminal domain-containing protein [Candidatus Kapabacteria bacterium]|nr:LytR C-terminal domain-containing protein [Candidatus Kapabacteria bacterium]